MNQQSTNAARVLAAWEQAYSEAGPSPSASDLIVFAHEIDPARWPDPAGQSADAMSGLLFRLMSHGDTLTTIIAAVYEIDEDFADSVPTRTGVDR